MGDDVTGGGGGDLVRDEEDHDLMTFAEGGIRLREEIASTRAELAEAERSQAPPERREALRARAAALTEALARNTRQAAENPGETGFLSYRPPARPGVSGSSGASADGSGA